MSACHFQRLITSKFLINFFFKSRVLFIANLSNGESHIKAHCEQFLRMICGDDARTHLASSENAFLVHS